MDEIIEDAITISDKRLEAMKQAIPCPACGTDQVQLVNWIDNIEWKCRHCSNVWSEIMNNSKRKVVCAACKHPNLDLILCGARHWDSVMNDQFRSMAMYGEKQGIALWEQGFIDQRGVFMDREEAMQVAKDAKQPIDIKRGCGGSETVLYSEGLY